MRRSNISVGSKNSGGSNAKRRPPISNSKVKLLALDLDGTLLNSSGNVSEVNIEAIRKAEENGVLVTIATGRRFRDARPVGQSIGLNAPLVTHNGALIKYADSLETVAASLIPLETSLEILKVGREFGSEPLVSADPNGLGSLYYDRISDDNVHLKSYIRWAERLHGDEAGQSVTHVDDLEALLAGTEVIHISYSGTCSRMEVMHRMLEAELLDSVNVLSTIYPALDFTLIDILPPDASKGIGLEKLAALNGLTAENVMAVGDNFNDLQMLEFAGTPVVMGNADPGLLEREEFYTTVSNDENGVAVAIGKFILGQETF